MSDLFKQLLDQGKVLEASFGEYRLFVVERGIPEEEVAKHAFMAGVDLILSLLAAGKVPGPDIKREIEQWRAACRERFGEA